MSVKHKFPCKNYSHLLITSVFSQKMAISGPCRFFDTDPETNFTSFITFPSNPSHFKFENSSNYAYLTFKMGHLTNLRPLTVSIIFAFFGLKMRIFAILRKIYRRQDDTGCAKRNYRPQATIPWWKNTIFRNSKFWPFAGIRQTRFWFSSICHSIKNRTCRIPIPPRIDF